MKNTLTKLLTLAFLSIGTMTFAQTQKGQDIDGEAAGDQSGTYVSMPDANTVAIGADFNSGNATFAGHVRIYSWNGTVWTQKGSDINGEAAWDYSGVVCMPDANTVAIGARGNNGNGDDAGHVRIYSWNGTAWTQKGSDIDGEAAGDESGYSVCMPDANTVAIGAISSDGNGNNAGHVRIYIWNGTAWIQKGIDIDGEAANDHSGWPVNMPDSNTVAIGAQGNDGNGNNSGHVRIYSWNGTAWIQKGSDIDGEAAGDNSGRSVSMPDANTVAIGAPYNTGNGNFAGHVRIYSWNGTAWAQKGSDIDGEAWFGSGISVSMPNANTVAIGAYAYNANHGRVRIYSWNGAVWTQLGSDIDGEAAGDNSGWSVSMPNANTVAIGAKDNYGNGSYSGHVRIYSLGSPLPIELISFKAECVQNNVLLKWTTASETYNDFFTLEHSKDAINWIELATIHGAGNSNLTQHYSYTDQEPYQSLVYYRLKQTDLDGQFTYSSITSLNCNHSQSTEINAYPTPTKGKLNLEFNTNLKEVKICIKNLMGQEIFSESYHSQNQIELYIEGAPGIYFVEVLSEGKQRVMKVVKE